MANHSEMVVQSASAGLIRAGHIDMDVCPGGRANKSVFVVGSVPVVTGHVTQIVDTEDHRPRHLPRYTRSRADGGGGAGHVDGSDRAVRGANPAMVNTRGIGIVP